MVHLSQRFRRVIHWDESSCCWRNGISANGSVNPLI